MRVLHLTSESQQTFEQYGTANKEHPRRSVIYPFYGALTERGAEVEVDRVGAIERTARQNWSRPERWLSVYGDIPRLLRRIRDYDITLAWGSFGAALAFMARALKVSDRIAIFSFTNSLGRHGSARRVLGQFMYTHGARAAGKVIFMTERQAQEAVEKLHCDPDRVFNVVLGVDTEFFVPLAKQAGDGERVRNELRAAADAPYMVVAGDQLRDETVVASALEATGLGLIRLTRNQYIQAFWRKRTQTLRSKGNVFCVANLTPVEVRFAYQNAALVLNLVDNSWQPAGWSVITEGMACGRPVIMNSGLVTDELNRLYANLDFQQPPFCELLDGGGETAVTLINGLRNNQQLGKNVGAQARWFTESMLRVDQTGEAVYSLLAG